jgi:DNA-binding transcriptional LysR family regulator
MASAASALRRAASGEAQELRGSVRITASEAIGTEVLPGILAAFRELYPGIVVEVVVSNRTQDLLRREADIAIRNVRPAQGALITRKVGVLQVGLHAHPSYLKAHGEPHTVEQLRKHPLIGFDKEASMAPANAPIPVTRELFSFRCDDEIVQYAAVRAGFGLGVCQVALAKRDGLVRVLPDDVAFHFGVWVVMHRDLKTHRRVRVMFDHLVRRLQKHIASELD